MEEQSKAVPPAGRGRRAKAVLFVTLVAVSAGIVGSVATRAFGHGPGHWRAGIFTPAQIEQRVDRAIKHLAIEADATAEQQAKLAAIANAATKDLLPLREKQSRTAGRRSGCSPRQPSTVPRSSSSAPSNSSWPTLPASGWRRRWPTRARCSPPTSARSSPTG